MSAKRSPASETTFGSTIGSVHIRHWDIGRPKRFIFRARERPVKNDAAVEIRKERGFPQPLAKPCWVSHISHRPDGRGHSQRSIFQRRRSTLEKTISCPK